MGLSKLKIRVYSDLHNEHRENDYEIPHLEGDGETTLILAGDINSSMEGLVRYLKSQCTRFKNVVFVFGNHDYYNKRIDSAYNDLKGRTKHIDNLFIGQGELLLVDGVYLYLDTLWTKGYKELTYRLSDYRLIRDFSTSSQTRKYKKSMEKIGKMLDGLPKDGKLVTVTHFSPFDTDQFMNPNFNRNILTKYFCHEGNEIINKLASRSSYWFFGHTHYSLEIEYKSCNFISNQVGYPNKIEFGIKHKIYEVKK